MNLHALRGKTIVLFGQPRALSQEEFDRLLKTAGITLAETFDSETQTCIEGRLVNPLEQQTLDRLYAEQGITPIDINTFEHALCSQIEPERILMSLKLSRDQHRLSAFLQNPHIDDTFFLRLLRLYDWKKEGFFDSNENRDVTAALIGRFYAGIERNHNIQYATLGLMHLIAQHDNDALIQTLGMLAVIRNGVRSKERQLRAVVEALAKHPATDEATLETFVRQGDVALRTLIAARPGLSGALQKMLFYQSNADVTTALASNPTLDASLADHLCDDPEFAPVVYANITLEMQRFEEGLPQHADALATNPTLTLVMQHRLFDQGEKSALVPLAANPSLQITEKLAACADSKIHRALAANPALSAAELETFATGGHCDVALASNPSSAPSLLHTLFATGNPELLAALAANPSTPLQLLQQLQLDARFERSVRGNAAFAHHIKRENIGWL